MEGLFYAHSCICTNVAKIYFTQLLYICIYIYTFIPELKPNTMLLVTNFSFTIDGLSLTYTFNGQTITAKYDASAACDLLKGAGFIEDWTTDSNGEPVILFSDNNHPIGYGYELWCDFVKSFFITERVAEMLAEWRERLKNIARFNGRINYMLYPLKATA